MGKNHGSEGRSQAYIEKSREAKTEWGRTEVRALPKRCHDCVNTTHVTSDIQWTCSTAFCFASLKMSVTKTFVF